MAARAGGAALDCCNMGVSLVALYGSTGENSLYLL